MDSFNIVVEKETNQIISIVQGFEVNKEFLDDFYEKNQGFDYFAEVELDSNILKESAESYEKINNDIDISYTRNDSRISITSETRNINVTADVVSINTLNVVEMDNKVVTRK